MKNKGLKIKKNNIVYRAPLGPRNYMICVRTRKEIVKKARELAITRAESAREALLFCLSRAPNTGGPAGKALEAVIDFAIDRVL